MAEAIWLVARAHVLSDVEALEKRLELGRAAHRYARMLEALLVLAFVAAICGGAVAWSLFATEAILLAGLWLVAAGFALGIPTGFWYHVELRRALVASGSLTARWWLHPTRLHGAIPPERWWRVMGWCYAGALGWLVSFAGCCVFALGAAKLLVASG